MFNSSESMTTADVMNIFRLKISQGVIDSIIDEVVVSSVNHIFDETMNETAEKNDYFFGDELVQWNTDSCLSIGEKNKNFSLFLNETSDAEHQKTVAKIEEELTDCLIIDYMPPNSISSSSIDEAKSPSPKQGPIDDSDVKKDRFSCRVRIPRVSIAASPCKQTMPTCSQAEEKPTQDQPKTREKLILKLLKSAPSTLSNYTPLASTISFDPPPVSIQSRKRKSHTGRVQKRKIKTQKQKREDFLFSLAKDLKAATEDITEDENSTDQYIEKAKDILEKFASNRAK